MKQFPVLYKRTKGNKIQEWSIKISPIEIHYQLIIKQGHLDGKKQFYTEEVTEGKQNRTILEQAELQAQSRWNEKRDLGYKSLEELDIQIIN